MGRNNSESLQMLDIIQAVLSKYTLIGKIWSKSAELYLQLYGTQAGNKMQKQCAQVFVLNPVIETVKITEPKRKVQDVTDKQSHVSIKTDYSYLQSTTHTNTSSMTPVAPCVCSIQARARNKKMDLQDTEHKNVN
jgi:hypothetical protein